MRFCANMCIKNCFTSDINFDPRLTIKQARKLGFVRNDENYAPTPNDMRFFLPKNKVFFDLSASNYTLVLKQFFK